MSEATPYPGTIAVVGLGLVGGSLVRSFARLPSRPRVLGSSLDAKDRAGAERVPGVKISADGTDIVAEADLVIYAVPLGATIELITKHAGSIRADALVTDVAGLKRPVLAAASAAGIGDRFIGSHPMAGGEGAGFDAGRADLFENARVWLCAGDQAKATAAHRLDDFWSGLGARPEWIDPDKHDLLMVRVSHLPQLVSNALALALEHARVDPDALGPGGRDMTRLAASSPGMWVDLLEHTHSDAAGLLRSVSEQIDEMAKSLEKGDVKKIGKLMKRTREWRSGK